MSAAYMRKCAGKGRHDSRESAGAEKSGLTSKNKLGQKRISVYRCDQCLGWHVGGSTNAFITRQRRSGKRPNKRLRGRV